MKRLFWIGLILALVAAAVVVVVGLERLARQLPDVGSSGGGEKGEALRAVRLYFGAHDRVDFMSEERVIREPGNDEDLAMEIIGELFRGPAIGVSALWSGGEVRSIYLDADGTGYVDLTAGTFAHWPRGDAQEWIGVGSVVRSVTENVPAFRRIQFLVEGRIVQESPGSIPIDLPLDAGGFPTQAEAAR